MWKCTFPCTITGPGPGSMAHVPSRGNMTVTQRRQQRQKKEGGQEDVEYSPTKHLQRKKTLMTKIPVRSQNFNSLILIFLYPR